MVRMLCDRSDVSAMMYEGLVSGMHGIRHIVNVRSVLEDVVDDEGASFTEDERGVGSDIYSVFEAVVWDWPPANVCNPRA